MEVKLNGWKAIVVILAVIGFGAFRYKTQTKAMETQGVEKIQQWLSFKTARAVLPEMEKAMENPEANREQLEQMANSLQSENFVVTSVKQHGLGEEIVVRVEAQVNGKPQVFYLRMEYSMTTGWYVGMETTKVSYYLALF